MSNQKSMVVNANNQNNLPSEVLGNIRPKDLEVIKGTVAKGATDSELAMFLTLANRYGLDPFLKEIWCIKRRSQDPAVIMTSRDGYLKIAQSHPDFLGLKSFVVKEGDEFEIDANSDSVKHKFGAKRGPIIGAWAACYRKGRKPAICFVDYNEYRGNSPVWAKYPSAMIQKVAESFALKRQFSISGLVTQEEMDAGLDEKNGNGNGNGLEEKELKEKEVQARVLNKPGPAGPIPETKVETNVVEVEEADGSTQATQPQSRAYTVLGVRPSAEAKDFLEVALADENGEPIVVFALPDMAGSVQGLAKGDRIEATIAIENGLTILDSFSKITKAKKNAQEETAGTPQQIEIIGQLQTIGFANKERTAVGGRVIDDLGQVLTVVTKDSKLIDFISQSLTTSKAGSGSRVKVRYKKEGDFNILLGFEVLEAVKEVG